MKKALYILAIGVVAVACSKGSHVDSATASVGGNNTYNNSPAGQYMMFIADDLTAGALNELETSLPLKKSEVSWASRFRGMTIVKADGKENTWVLTYEGAFSMGGNMYDTHFSIVATREDESESHADWTVTLTGSRKERDGYSCRFNSLGSLNYRTAGSETGWNQIYGRLSMDVFKNDARKDTGLLVFNGTPSAAQFVHGL